MLARPVPATILAVIAWVIPSVALAEAGLLAVRHLIPLEVLAASNDVVGNYLQTLGSIYAVLLAFVVFVVWTQFDEARRHVEREVNELVDLSRTARALPEPTCRHIAEAIAAYVAEVTEREWPSMARTDGRFEAGNRILDRLWNALVECEAATHGHQALFGRALEQIDALSDARSNRITSSRTQIPLALHILLYFGAVVMVGSMYLLAVDEIAVHLLITGALAGGLSHVLFVIHDLDDSFAGAWQVTSAPFRRVENWLKGRT